MCLVSGPSLPAGLKGLALTRVPSPPPWKIRSRYSNCRSTSYSSRNCLWIYHNWAIRLLRSRMALIANCSLYGGKDTGNLISLDHFFSFMAPAVALNIPSAFLTPFRGGSELHKCYEEGSSRAVCGCLRRGHGVERGCEN